MRLVFATANQHKADEIQKMVGDAFQILTLKDIQVTEDVPETSATIQGNAIQKADYITLNYKENCFADDTGLEIEALNGEPGVYSARYAGPDKNDRNNIEKVLTKLKGVTNRVAYFKTVIALNLNGKQHLFEGICEGEIIDELKGEGGFGYDPIFIPTGFDRTFAEMTIEEKNEISHRARATKKMIEFLKGLD